MFLMIEFCHIFDCSALYFPPVEKRLSSPPRLTPLSTNNFVRCTFQNRIIISLFSKVRRKNKNKKNNTSFKLHMKKTKQQIFPCNNKTTKMFVYDILPLPLLFSYTEVYINCLIMMTENNQLKDVKKK